MFEVTPTETIALAQTEGMTCVQRLKNGDNALKRPGISWDRLTFKRST
jgi:hypothetical protein